MTSTATAAAGPKNFGAYQDAAVRDPVIITKNGRAKTVLIAYEEYLRLTKRERHVELTSARSKRPRWNEALDHPNAEFLTGKHTTVWIKSWQAFWLLIPLALAVSQRSRRGRQGSPGARVGERCAPPGGGA